MASRNSERIKRDEEELELMIKPEGQVAQQDEDQQENNDQQKDEVFSKEEESYKKRYGDLRRHMQQKEKEWEDRFNALENKASGKVVPPKSDEDLDQWIEKNPDIAGIVALLAKRQAEDLMKETRSEVEVLTQLRKDSAKERAEAEIISKHPDFLKIREADDFHNWAEEQPKWIQDSIYENDTDSKAIIRALDLYKMDKGLTKEDKKRQEKDAASLVKTPRKADVAEEADGEMFSESQVQRMSITEYTQKEEAIQKAIRSGKFKYDLSGGAR